MKNAYKYRSVALSLMSSLAISRVAVVVIVIVIILVAAAAGVLALNTKSAASTSSTSGSTSSSSSSLSSSSSSIASSTSSASSSSSSGGSTYNNGTLIIGSATNNINSLNPLFETNFATIPRFFFSGLVNVAPNLTAVPDAAARWNASADLKTWTFTLRNDVFFF